MLSYESGNFKESISNFRKSLQYQKNDTDAWINLGLSYLAIEKIHDAISAFNAAININDSCVAAFINLAAIYMERKCWDRSIPLYKKVLEMEPWNEEARCSLSFAQELATSTEMESSYESSSNKKTERNQGFMFLNSYTDFNMARFTTSTTSQCSQSPCL